MMRFKRMKSYIKKYGGMFVSECIRLYKTLVIKSCYANFASLVKEKTVDKRRVTL